MSQKEWGNITWMLFHTLAEKINDSDFDNVKNDILFFIKQTCNHLPCPICSDHATNTLKKVNFNLIKTKADLIEFLRQFHNVVNIRTDKPIVEKEFVITYYKNLDIVVIINHFIRVYSHKYGNFDVSAFNRSNQRSLYLKNSIPKLKYFLKYCY